MGTERELVMRQAMVRRHGLLSDVLMAMRMEIDQVLRSHDATKMYMVTRKWETLLGELIPVKVRRR